MKISGGFEFNILGERESLIFKGISHFSCELATGDCTACYFNTVFICVTYCFCCRCFTKSHTYRKMKCLNPQIPGGSADRYKGQRATEIKH